MQAGLDTVAHIPQRLITTEQGGYCLNILSCVFLITHLHKDANVAKNLKVWPLPPNTCGSESIIISLGRKRKSVVETSFKSDPLLPYLSSLNAKQS